MLKEIESVSIKYARIFATVCIFLCHLATSANNTLLELLGMFLNVGIYIFLFISGYLYSQKRITKKQSIFIFLRNRYIRTSMPVIIWMIIVIVINLICGYEITLKQVIGHIFNLEIFFPQIFGMHHLWFVSVIMICYILKYYNEYLDIKPQVCFFVGVCFLMLFSLNGNSNWITYTICVITFMAGLYGRQSVLCNYKINREKMLWGIIISLFIRIIGWKLFDGLDVYYIIVGITQMNIGICSFCLIMSMDKYLIKLYNNIFWNRIIEWLNSISYEFYIVHYLFINGAASVLKLNDIRAFNYLVCVFSSIFSAHILHVTIQIINRTMEKAK